MFSYGPFQYHKRHWDPILINNSATFSRKQKGCVLLLKCIIDSNRIQTVWKRKSSSLTVLIPRQGYLHNGSSKRRQGKTIYWGFAGTFSDYWRAKPSLRCIKRKNALHTYTLLKAIWKHPDFGQSGKTRNSRTQTVRNNLLWVQGK